MWCTTLHRAAINTGTCRNDYLLMFLSSSRAERVEYDARELIITVDLSVSLVNPHHVLSTPPSSHCLGSFLTCSTVTTRQSRVPHCRVFVDSYFYPSGSHSEIRVWLTAWSKLITCWIFCLPLTSVF